MWFKDLHVFIDIAEEYLQDSDFIIYPLVFFFWQEAAQ